MTSQVRIGVGLVTYNGQKYLCQQLDSIKSPPSAELIIKVLDLSSKDMTPQILEEYRKEGRIQEIFKASKLSPNEAFFKISEELLDCDFITFCDQDDIWNPNKLEIAINSIGLTEIPTGFSSNRIYIDENGQIIGNSNIYEKKVGKWNAIVESSLYGNTLVLNRSALKQILQHRSKKMFFYDSFCYLYLSFFGVIKFDRRCLIKYRLHSHNLVGIKRRGIGEIKKSILAFYRQAEDFYVNFKDVISIEDRDKFESYLKIFKEPNKVKKVFLVWKSPTKRMKMQNTNIFQNI